MEINGKIVDVGDKIKVKINGKHRPRLCTVREVCGDKVKLGKILNEILVPKAEIIELYKSEI